MTSSCHQQNQAILQASYEIAKNTKSHTVGKNPIEPCILKSVKLVLGETSEDKMQC